MKSFLFLLTLPSETVEEVERMAPNQQQAKVRRLIEFNRGPILRQLQQAVLDQIRNPRELAELHQGPGGESARIVSRMKERASDLPETHGDDHA